jgi:hypothetical protein
VLAVLMAAGPLVPVEWHDVHAAEVSAADGSLVPFVLMPATFERVLHTVRQTSEVANDCEDANADELLQD